MEIIKATIDYRNAVLDLLATEKLPFKDISACLEDFLLAIDGDKMVGVVGMERYGTYGLLRSLVVHPCYRSKCIASLLINNLEEIGNKSGITILYLLTETAAVYFEKRGYKYSFRNEVPDEVQASKEFSSLCSASAVAMHKKLIP